MKSPPDDVAEAYLVLLERAMVNLRTRLRSGEQPSRDELHDFLDALHNVPGLLRNYGGWYIEENIDWYLARYDERWVGSPDSEFRASLVETLRRARRGDYTAAQE